MKKIVYSSIVLILTAISIVLWQFWGERYVLSFTEEQLVEKLNEKFPIDKNLFFLHLRFINPKLVLEEGSDRIRFGCEVETNIKVGVNEDPILGSLRGTALLSGKLRYERDRGAFFLDQPLVESLKIAGLPSKYSEKVGYAANQLVVEGLQRAPIYRLHPLDIKQSAARMVLRKVVVSDKKLVVTLGIGE